MPRYIIKEEGIVEKFLLSLFDSIVHQRQDRVKKALQKDPKLQKLYSDVDSSVKKIRNHLAQEPENRGIDYPELMDKLDKLL